MTDSPQRDARVLTLRSAGASFHVIRQELRFDRTGDVTRAFNRALRRQPGPIRERILKEEAARLDIVEHQVRAMVDVTPERRQQLLGVVTKMRAAVVSE